MNFLCKNLLIHNNFGEYIKTWDTREIISKNSKKKKKIQKKKYIKFEFKNKFLKS
jgi:hypothetical protein